MASATGPYAEQLLKQFLSQTAQTTPPPCLQQLAGVGPEAVALRRDLLCLRPSSSFCLPSSSSCTIQPSIDDLFLGRILYECCLHDMDTLLMDRLSYLSLGQQYSISSEAQAVIQDAVAGTRDTNISRMRTRRVLRVTQEALRVMYKHQFERSCGDTTITLVFVRAILGIGPSESSARLPAFKEIHSHFLCAVLNRYNRINTNDPVHRFSAEDSNAWSRASMAARSGSTDKQPHQKMTAVDCFAALENLTQVFQTYLSESYIDVKLGITQENDIPEDRATLFENIKVIEEKIAIQRKAAMGRAHGIYGYFLSPVFCEDAVRTILHDLPFAMSPKGGRRLRVSSKSPQQLFILSGRPVESVSFSALEEHLCRIGCYLFAPGTLQSLL